MKDAALEFSVAQALTATANSQNVIDLGPTKATARDIGPGTQTFLVVSIPAQLLSAGASTLTFELWTDSQVSMATQNRIYVSEAIPKAQLTVGAIPVVIAVPSSTKQYLRMTYTVGTGPFTAGAVDAYISLDPPRFALYPRNYTV